MTQPDAAQAALLERLGLVLPKRMRRSDLELPAAALSASAQRPFHPECSADFLAKPLLLLLHYFHSAQVGLGRGRRYAVRDVPSFNV